jgi:hypothetical protein
MPGNYGDRYRQQRARERDRRQQRADEQAEERTNRTYRSRYEAARRDRRNYEGARPTPTQQGGYMTADQANLMNDYQRMQNNWVGPQQAQYLGPAGQQLTQEQAANASQARVFPQGQNEQQALAQRRAAAALQAYYRKMYQGQGYVTADQANAMAVYANQTLGSPLPSGGQNTGQARAPAQQFVLDPNSGQMRPVGTTPLPWEMRLYGPPAPPANAPMPGPAPVYGGGYGGYGGYGGGGYTYPDYDNGGYSFPRYGQSSQQVQTNRGGYNSPRQRYQQSPDIGGWLYNMVSWNIGK